MPRALPSLPAAAALPASPLWGIGLLIASMWVLPWLDASGKWLMAVGIPMLFLSWVRYAMHLVFVLTLIVPARGWGVLRSRHPYAQALRGISMMSATVMFFTTLSYLPQAEGTAINYLAPFFVLLVAPWVLREPAKLSRWLAASLSFVGVLIIIRPGSGLNPAGVGFGLLGALSFAGQYIFTRRVAGDDPYTSVIWSGAVGTAALTLALPISLPMARPVLDSFGPLQWAVLLSTGVTGGLGHLLQISAYRRAPASMLAPLSYFAVVSATVVGWIVTGHVPDAVTWLGIGVICASGLALGYLEWRLERPAAA
jgi:drug/metabolite transporter (DMT)-like permease